MANKQRIVLLLEGDAKGAIKATVETGKGLDKVTEKGKNTSKQLRDLTEKGVKWGAAAAGAAAAGTALLIKQQLDLIDNTAKTSDKLGIATEKLTAMRVQAELTGVGAGTMDMALQRMVRRLAEAAEGTGEAKGALAELNLDAQAMAKLSPDKQFGAIADAMENVDKQSDKVRLAFKLFDSEGVALVNTLKGGSAAALEAEQFTEQWGLAINRVDASKIEQANDALTMASQASQGFWKQLTVNVSPAITGIAKEMLGFGESFGTSGELADKAFKAIVTGAGFVADMGRVLHLVFKGATWALAQWYAGFADTFAGADRIVTSLLNKLPEALGGGSFETSDFLQNLSGALRSTATEIGKEFTELLEKPLASTTFPQKIKEWEETATAAGEKVAASAKVVAGDYEAAAGAAEILTAAEQKRRNEAEKLAAQKADLFGDAEYQVGLLSRELTATYEGAEALAAFNREKFIEAALRSESAQKLLPAELEKYKALMGAQYDLAEAIKEKTEADKAAADAAKDAAGAMDKFLNGSFGDGLAEGFNQGSKALSSFIDGFSELLDVQEQYNAAQLDASATEAEKAKAAELYQSAQIGLYGDMAAASKQFFDEGSSGYEALQKAEQTFRLFEIAMAGKALAAKLFTVEASTAATVASVAPTVAAEGAKATAAGAAAAASSMVGTPFPANLGALAATIAALAAIGVLVGGGGGSGGLSASQQAQQTQGTGTVLGDSSAKSDSAFKALDLMEQHLSDGLQVSSGMLSELRALNANIAGLGNLLGRQLDFSGGLIDAGTGSALGGAGSLVDDTIMDALDVVTLGFADDLDKLLGGIVGSVGGAISSKSSKKVDEGLQILGGDIADIIDGGIVDALAYAKIRTKKRKLGSGTKTSYSTITESLGDEIAGQFGQVIGSVYESVFSAIEMLGVGDTSGLSTFAGLSISTKGLSAEDAQKEIGAVLSAFADDVASSVIPSLINFQNVGEGLFETLTRVATQVAIFRDTNDALGVSIVNLSNEGVLVLADDLATAAGGIENYAENMRNFTELVLTDAEKFGQTQGYVAAMFDRLGLAVPPTTDALKQLVATLDADAFTAITSASDLLDDYYSKLEDYTKSAYDFDTALGLNDGRKELREALAAVGHNLDVVETAAQSGVSALAQLFNGLTDVQKSGLEPFTDAILALSPALKSASAIANERANLEVQLLQLLGDTDELRRREREALDASNRSLYDQINAVRDQQAANAELARSFEQLRSVSQGIQQYLDGLAVSDYNGTPLDQASTAVQQFRNLAQSALGGDVDAAQQLTSAASTALSLSESAYASGAQFQSVFNEVKATLANVASSINIETFEQQQIRLLEEQLAALDQLGESLTVELTTSSTSEIEKLIKYVTDTDDFPDDLKTLALSSASTFTKTLDYLVGTDLPPDAKLLALSTTSVLTKTANYVVGATLPSDLKELALTQSSGLLRTINAEMAAGADYDAVMLALKSSNVVSATVNALLASGYDQNALELAMLAENSISATVNATLASGANQQALNLAFAQSGTITKSIQALKAGGYNEQAAAIASAYSSTIYKTIQASGGNLNTDQRAILNTLNGSSNVNVDADVLLRTDATMSDLLNSLTSLSTSMAYYLDYIRIYTRDMYTLFVNFGLGSKALTVTSKNQSGSSYARFADGGYVSGAGTGTSDSISAMLSNGEYVVKASAVKNLGVGFLDNINAGSVPVAPVSMPRLANNNAELVAELRTLRKDLNTLMTQQNKDINHQTHIGAAGSKQSIDQLKSINNRVANLESAIKTAELLRS